MANSSCFQAPTEQDPGVMTTFWIMWLCAIPLVTICVTALLANGTILLMYVFTKKLRKCRNTYIVSLAFADFAIGCTLPFSILETLSERWPLSYKGCLIFLTFRYSLYFVSVLSIILITVDRWWSVNFPFSYRVRQSKKVSVVLVLVSWLLSFAIHIPTIATWDLLHMPTHKPHGYCRLPYEYNIAFTTTSSFIEYFVPLLVLAAMNVCIYFKLVRRRNSKKLRRSLSMSDTHSLTNRKSSSESENTVTSDDTTDMFSLISQRGDGRRSSMFVTSCRRYSGVPYVTSKIGMSSLSRGIPGRRVSIDLALLAAHSRRQSFVRKPSQTSMTSRSKRKDSDDIVKDFLVRQDNKALLSLGLLVAMFVICWTPMTICDLIYALCPQQVPMWLVQIAHWTLALNPAMNPFLYGVGNSDFRRVSRSWFTCFRRQKSTVQEALLFPVLQNGEMEALKEVEHSSPIKMKTESL